MDGLCEGEPSTALPHGVSTATAGPGHGGDGENLEKLVIAVAAPERVHMRKPSPAQQKYGTRKHAHEHMQKHKTNIFNHTPKDLSCK